MASFPVSQVTEGKWKSVKLVEILGLKLPAHMTTDPQLLHDFISNFETRPDDVFVVGFPKSGTTWMQEIVWQIKNNGEVRSNVSALERVPFLELATNPHVPQPDIKTLPSPRILKTHLPYDVIPKGANGETLKGKYVYIARNPKDAAVSHFEFVTSLASMNGYNGPWEFYVKSVFVAGNAGWNLWNDHVLSWWKHKDDPNVLFIKYEDLRKDLVSHVRMIAKFLNKQLSDDLIKRIAEQCSFSGMKKNASSYSIPTKQGEVNSMLRKGVVGDWKNYFTPELNERFEKEVLAKLNGSGLEFDFEM